MIYIRKSSDRGFFDHGWLQSYHTFSFAEYHDPKHMQWGPLRVINEDVISGGAGFPTHPHRNMEIVTYPISGAIAHEDSSGSNGVIYPYDVQKMTAGSGIYHSEYNYLKDKNTHLLQIWIIPDEQNLVPVYEQANFKEEILSGREVLLASPNREQKSLKIHQDAFIWAKKFELGESWIKTLDSHRKYWIQVVQGSLKVTLNNSHESSINLAQGDGLGLTDEKILELIALESAEILIFDMTSE
jgi:quercetin 2,3-dioxygenase